MAANTMARMAQQRRRNRADDQATDSKFGSTSTVRGQEVKKQLNHRCVAVVGRLPELATCSGCGNSLL